MGVVRPHSFFPLDKDLEDFVPVEIITPFKSPLRRIKENAVNSEVSAINGIDMCRNTIEVKSSIRIGLSSNDIYYSGNLSSPREFIPFFRRRRRQTWRRLRPRSCLRR
jgi:hypothetical protein